MMNFDTIEYLKYGTNKQRKAYKTLTEENILTILENFDPILAGTVPLEIDIANSDLDIICYFTDITTFVETIKRHFGKEKGFSTKEVLISGNTSIVANFLVNEFEIELFGQNIPTRKQLGYRHMIIEYNLLQQYGAELRKRIVSLKNQGYKTEPAFAIELNLPGDPYDSLLKFEIKNNEL